MVKRPKRAKIITTKKVVVSFDMCSSSRILQDLHSHDNIGQMKELLLTMNKFLKEEAEALGYEIYKFTGDGWILLFPSSTDGDEMMGFLKRLSLCFVRGLLPIKERLDVTPKIIGLTFGVDKGKLIRFEMMDKVEYVGRAINVACRLQDAVKRKNGSSPQYKVMVSKTARADLKLKLSKYAGEKKAARLRNISPRFECYQLRVLPKPPVKVKTVRG